MWNWSVGDGSRAERSRAPLVYWVAWPGSEELLVGAKIFFWVGAAECNILGGGWRCLRRCSDVVGLLGAWLSRLVLRDSAAALLISMGDVVLLLLMFEVDQVHRPHILRCGHGLRFRTIGTKWGDVTKLSVHPTITRKQGRRATINLSINEPLPEYLIAYYVVAWVGFLAKLH